MLGWDLTLDYIIFGVGSGATLIVLGWLLRQFGPIVRDRPEGEGTVLSASDLVLRMGWSRFCATCGAALFLCGTLVVLVAIGTMLVAVDDDRGGWIVLGSFAVALPLMLVWLGLFLRRFGSIGVVRRAGTRYQPAPAAIAGSEMPEPDGESDNTVTDDAVGAVTQDAPESDDEATFSDTVTSPGGLGRFAAFFRKDDPADDAGESEAWENDSPDGDDDHQARRDVTDAVIAAISTKETPDEEKRLDPSDPLVTAVMDDVDSLEPVQAEMAPDGDAPDDDDASSPKPVDEQEAALVALREQRKKRLSNQG